MLDIYQVLTARSGLLPLSLSLSSSLSFEEVVRGMIKIMRAAQAAENGEDPESGKEKTGRRKGRKDGKKGDKDCIVS